MTFSEDAGLEYEPPICPHCGEYLFYPSADGEDVDRLVCECGYEEGLR